MLQYVKFNLISYQFPHNDRIKKYLLVTILYNNNDKYLDQNNAGEKAPTLLKSFTQHWTIKGSVINITKSELEIVSCQVTYFHLYHGQTMLLFPELVVPIRSSLIENCC